jgi:3'(2'), 5'-bisphosphate nucleotidase
MSISSLKEKYPDLVVSMRKAAVLAGLEILDVYAQSDFGIQIKSDESPLTLADLRADKAIATTLAELVPDIPIVSEETYAEGDRLRDAIFFLVDPLDGTKEFIKKTGEFTVNIALIVQGKAALGVVYVPVSGDLFYRDLDGLSYVESDASRVERRGQIAQITVALWMGRRLPR